MNFKTKFAVLAIGAAMSSMAFNASACSTIIIGKDASATGNILVGHNEDNGGRILTAQYWVPAATHQAGEMIKYEPAAATIPQVEKTFGFFWSQTYSPKGASFSDGFVNENGVVIVSNACSGIYEDDIMPLKDGGIGYGIRRLMAERATSARHAIDIAIDLLGKYGYNSQGRTYTVADKNEAWQIAIHQGNTWVARRVQDNEIVYIPNNFMMDKVDATDTKNFIVAPGMIERAIKNGRYKPAKEGVYSDFNFRVAVAPAARRASEVNATRNNLAWNKIIGENITDPEKFPYSAIAQKKWTVADVEDLLRTHEHGMLEQDAEWSHTNGYGICRGTTHEAEVYELNDNPLLISGYRALSRPCEVPFIPFFPLARPAEGAAFMTWDQATAEHFKGTAKNFSWHGAWPVTTFVAAANTFDFQRDDMKAVRAEFDKLETAWKNDVPAVAARAKSLLKVSNDKAVEYLHAYNQRMMNEATSAVAEQLAEKAPWTVAVMADSINQKSDAEVQMVLFSSDKLDASKADPKKSWAGVGRASIGNKVTVDKKLAHPVKTEIRDVDGDGRKDMVFTFTQKDLAQNMIPGATFDIWLHTHVDGKRVAAMDTAFIEAK